MLHKNLQAVFDIFSDQRDADEFEFGFDSQRIEKIGGNIFRIHESFFWEWFKYNRRLYNFPYPLPWYPEVILPNILLTSDAYLKTPDEVDKFLKKYDNYLKEYWLLQIPHHGSRNNADRILFTRISHHVSKFINYGTRHRFEKKYKHPDTELIAELIAAGHGHDTIAVTEHAGLISYFNVHRS
jgi:hypothetical protein